MTLTEGIRRKGFRKWYERQLLQSHGHMTLTFLCAIGLFAAIEAAGTFRGWHDQLVDALAVLACAGIGVWSLRRYLFLLQHAEFVANQADCPQCGTYARFDLIAGPQAAQSATVRCRKCQRQWTING